MNNSSRSSKSSSKSSNGSRNKSGTNNDNSNNINNRNSNNNTRHLGGTERTAGTRPLVKINWDSPWVVFFLLQKNVEEAKDESSEPAYDHTATRIHVSARVRMYTHACIHAANKTDETDVYTIHKASRSVSATTSGEVSLSHRECVQDCDITSVVKCMHAFW